MILRIPLVGERAAQLLHSLDRFGQLPCLLQTHRTLEKCICYAYIPWPHHAAANLRLFAPSIFAVCSGKQRCEYGSGQQHKKETASEGRVHVRKISNRERYPRSPVYPASNQRSADPEVSKAALRLRSPEEAARLQTI
jgi:hypothetical protein